MLFFRTVPSANTLVRWVNENTFAFILQARPCPTFGRPVHLRGSPHRLQPGTSPHALRIPPRGGHPALRESQAVAPGSALAVSSFRLRARLGFSIPSSLPAREALPPRLDTALLIRAPEGLEPSRSTRCSAHNMPSADFCSAVRPPFDSLSRRSDTEQTSWGKLNRLLCTAAESTLRTLDGYGLCGK